MSILPIFLQVEEGDGVTEADEGVLRNDGDVVGPEVEVPQSVQRPESVARDLVQVVVAQTQVLQVLYTQKQTKKLSICVYTGVSGTHVHVQLTQIVPAHLRCRVNVNYAAAQRAASRRACCVCHCLRFADTNVLRRVSVPIVFAFTRRAITRRVFVAHTRRIYIFPRLY